MSTAIPETMLAIEVREPGGPEVLRPVTRPVPKVGPGEVLIQVAAAGVNRPDIFQRQGNYEPPPGASDLPGLEVAGKILGLGSAVTGWEIGDQVCALLAGGGYAQYVAAPAVQCLPVPAGLSVLEAAAVPETAFTVWSNLYDRCRLQPGEALLVHGGSSGIGTMAIQMATSLGSKVYVTAGSDEKCQACVKLGAKLAVNYRQQDFVEVVKAATDGGVDVILDMVGGDYLPRNIKLLKPEGRLVQIAFLQGSKVELNFAAVMMKRLTITGSTLRPQSVAAKAAIADALRERVWPLLNSGVIKPVIHATFPLKEAAAAHLMMEEGKHIGKIMLEV